MRLDMKIILIVLLLFKISSRASAEKNPNNCVYKRPNNSPQASRLTEYYCNSFNLHRLYYIPISKTDPIIKYKQKCYFECKKIIKPYFKKVDENEKSIDTFHKFCEEYNTDAWYCGKVMTHLKILCFNMESAVDLLRVVDRKTFMDTLNGYTRITILYEDWNEFKNIGNVNIKNCLFRFRKESLASSRFVMRMFKQWFDTDMNSVSQCNCTEIFGIYNIYRAKEENLEKEEGISMLKKYFQLFCLPTSEYDFKKLHIWSSKQFQGIADKAKNIKLEHIKSFLFEGTKIAEAKWFIANVSPRRWPFDYMIKEIRFDEKGYQSRIILISVVLNCMISITNYEMFRNEVSGDKDCVTLGCWITKFEEFRTRFELKLEKTKLSICMDGIKNFRASDKMYLPN